MLGLDLLGGEFPRKHCCVVLSHCSFSSHRPCPPDDRARRSGVGAPAGDSTTPAAGCACPGAVVPTAWGIRVLETGGNNAPGDVGHGSGPPCSISARVACSFSTRTQSCNSPLIPIIGADG